MTKSGLEVIFIDNNSSYPPLVEWYKTCPYKVHNIGYNSREIPFEKEVKIGHAPWRSGIIKDYGDRFYIVTDPDISIEGIPEGWINILMKGLHQSDVWKAGLSLKIDDLPDNEMTQIIKGHESAFYAVMTDFPEGDNFYKGPTSTTLALYDNDKYNGDFLNAIRSPEPYTCRHLPYYMTKDTLTDEYKNYIETSKWDGWDKQILKLT